MILNKNYSLSLKLFFLLLSFNIYGQQKEFTPDYLAIYNFRFRVDSLSNNYAEDNMALYISDKISIVQNLNSQKIDSVIYRNNANPINRIDFSTIKKTKFKFTIIKTPETSIFYEKLGNSFVGYKDNPNFDWKLVNEFRMINDYQCQKATLNFRGRNYIAWFTTEFLISEGPYKFKGLPGLIFEIYDTKNNFAFSLKSLKKYKKPIRYIDKISFINREDFYPTKLNYMESLKTRFINIQDKKRKKLIYNPIELE